MKCIVTALSPLTPVIWAARNQPMRTVRQRRPR
jgi:hypothetical protein